jgi:hypothetical protein
LIELVFGVVRQPHADADGAEQINGKRELLEIANAQRRVNVDPVALAAGIEHTDLAAITRRLLNVGTVVGRWILGIESGRAIVGVRGARREHRHALGRWLA